MKKWISVFLSLLMLCAVCAVPVSAAETDAFVPVLRFAAASDTHVKEDDDTNARRIEHMLQFAYAQAAADPSYQALDAVLIAGDLTNDGTKLEFDLFWNALSGALQGDTRFLGVVAKNHDGYKMSRAEVHNYYSALTGNDADFHVVINGYHFIGLSASENDAVHYDAGQRRWLKAQLDAATAEDPAKPVFVMHHEPPRGTVYGSSLYDGWGTPYFNAVLNQYPQVVDLAGHSHYPLNDPRSVWQGVYTAIGTGAIYYSEFTVDEFRAYDPPDCTDTATFWIIELDKDNNMRLRGYDVNEETLLCERILKNPADPANREYLPIVRRAAASAPAFGPEASLAVAATFGGCTVTVPAAISTDGEPVVLYRFAVKNGCGVTISDNWALPSYYRAVGQDSLDLTFTDLPAGTYTVQVKAENAYGMQSAPLTATVTVEGETGIKAFFVTFAFWFQKLKTFFSRVFS